MKQSIFGVEGIVTRRIPVPTTQKTLVGYFKKLGMPLECFEDIPNANQRTLWEYN